MSINRYTPNIENGLTEAQVNKRIKDNLINMDTIVPTKTIKQIISQNLFTLFNFLNFGLALLIFIVGSYKNMLFMGVVICNTLISTLQEINAKRTIDKLSLLAASKAKVLRNGISSEIDINEIVLDDIIDFHIGNQVVVDSIILRGECEVSESFITGEAKPIHKKEGDLILSGSFIISGSVRCQVEHIGLDNYTSQISNDAKYIKKVNSEIMYSLNKVIKTISFIIVPLGILLFIKQMSLPNAIISDAMITTVAALIGMIPEGLVLLTSTVLAVSVMRLSKSNVLVQELYCIENLARIDVLCLDKTGTITEGKLEVSDYIPLAGYSKKEIAEVLKTITANLDEYNPTFLALQETFNNGKKETNSHLIPFSSERKYSGISYSKGTFLIGAPEYLLSRADVKQLNLEKYTSDYRVLVVCHSHETINNYDKPNSLKSIGLILISDKIRITAPATLSYFAKEGVAIKIISGDNPVTVASIAKRAGLSDVNEVDATTLTTKEEIKKAMLKYNVFGRVTPAQKKEFVIVLKELGHMVAMTGDGVNDCLALKEADCSIAMASGSDAARNVSQLVLLDSDFASMPKVLLEGRRTINNIQRSATLFLVKTGYASLLAIIFLFLNTSYPFEPIQLTLTSAVTIGIPAFFLALEPNKALVRGNFLLNVISKSIPTALTITLTIVAVTIVGSILKLTPDQLSTLSVISTAYTGFVLLFNISKPFNIMRTILLTAMVGIFVFAAFAFKTFFSLTTLTFDMLILIAITMVISVIIYNYMTILTDFILKKYRKKILK